VRQRLVCALVVLEMAMNPKWEWIGGMGGLLGSLLMVTALSLQRAHSPWVSVGFCGALAVITTGAAATATDPKRQRWELASALVFWLALLWFLVAAFTRKS
jgi:uncharacterized membrane protein SirB2